MMIMLLRKTAASVRLFQCGCGLSVHLLLGLLLCLPAAESQEPGRERYVPAENLDAVFNEGAAGVMLPRAEFDALLKKAQAAQNTRNQQPVPSIVRNVAYRIRQEDVHAIIEMEIDVEQFLDDVVALSIPIGHLQAESATIGKAAAQVGLALDKPGELILLHPRAERFALKLVLSTPLGTAGSDQLAAVRLLPNAPASLSVECPKSRHLEVNNLQLDRPAPLDQSATYEVPIGNNSEVRLKWTSRRQKTDMQTLIFARTDATAELTSDNLRWNSATRVSVFGNSINQLVARVPALLEVTNVESSGLESWKLEDDPQSPGVTRVLLNYRQPFQDDRMVTLSAVAPLSAGRESKVPTLEFAEVTSHSGRLHVRHSEQFRLLANAGGGLRHLGNGTADSGGPAGEFFDFWMQNYELTVAVRPRDRELFAQVNSTLAIVETTATLTVDLTVESLNDSLFELPVNLPDGWQISDLTDSTGKPVKWRSGNAPTQVVVEPDVAVSSGGLLTLKISLTRIIADPANPQLLDLPVVTADGALTVGGTYEVSAAGDLRVTPLEISGLSPVGDEDGILLFETQGTKWSGRISIVRQTQRLASRSVVRSWMDQRQKTTEAVVTIDVLSGTIRSAELRLPADLGPDVRFQVVSIGAVPGLNQQQLPASVEIVEQAVGESADGTRIYALTFDKRFAGALTLRAVVQQERTEETTLQAAPIELIGAVRQHGLVVFDAYPEQQLAATKDSIAGLSIADAGMVSAPPVETGRRTALVYRYIQPKYSVSITETRFDTQPVPSAVCRQMDNISVLSDTGSVQRLSTAFIRCIGVQTLRFSLPQTEQTRLWSTVLNGNAIEVRRDGEDFVVAIPTDPGQTEHSLEILFQTSADSSTVLETARQQSVSLAIDSDGGEARPMDVLEQTWEIRFPDSSLLLSHDGGFQALSELDNPGWLRALAGWLRVPSADALMEKSAAIGVVLLALFVVTVLILRRRWKSLVAVCVLAGLGLFVLAGVGGRSADKFAVLTTSEPASGNMDSYWFDDSEIADEAPAAAEIDAAADEMYEAMAKSDTTNPVIFGLEMPQEESAESERSAPPQPAPTDAPAPLRRSRESAGAPARAGVASTTRAGGRPVTGTTVDSLGGQQQAAGSPFGGAGGMAGSGPHPGSPGGFGGRGAPAFANGLVLQEQIQQGQTAVSDESGNDVSGVLAGEILPIDLTGGARLSVRAEIADPDDYRSKQFRSVASGSDAGDLGFVVQPRSSLNALRVVAAAITLILCLLMLRKSALQKFSLAIILIAAAAALVPLLRPALQTIADGVVVGTLLGIVIWLLQAFACWLRRCCDCCRSFSFLKSRRTAATSIVAAIACVSSVAPAEAQQADQSGEILKPDVVLPYSSEGPALLADRVFLPKDDFLKLYRAANPDSLNEAASQGSGGVVAAFYKSGELRQVRADSWSQAFSVRYVIGTRGDQPVRVPLPIGMVALRSAMLDGEKAVVTGAPVVPPPVPENQQRQMPANQLAAPSQQTEPALAGSGASTGSAYHVRIPGAGLHVLDLEFDVPAVQEGLVGRVELPLRPVASGTLQFEMPADNLDVKVNGRSNTLRRDGKVVTVPVSTATAMRIEWQPKTTTTTADVVYHTTVNSALVINDAGLTVRAAVIINRRQGQLSEVAVAIPAEYAVQQVEGTELAGWNVLEGEDRQLRLMFREAISKETAVHLTLFRRQVLTTKPDELDVPVLAVTGASRDSGHLTVIAGRELEVRVNSLSGVSQINAGESQLPNGLANDIRRVLAWRYTRHPAAVSIRAFRTADRMVTRILNGVQVDPRRQLWTTLVSATITGSPRRRLEVILPLDFVVLDVSANELADWYIANAGSNEDSKVLNIQFHGARTGAVNAVIQSQLGTAEVTDQTRLIAPRILQSDEVTTNLSLWLDASVAYKGGSFEGWKRATAASPVDVRLLQLKPVAPAISFVSTEQAPGPIDVTLGRKPVTLTPESVSVTNVADTSLELTLGLHWRIENATRELSFTLPEELRDVFDFRIPGLRQLEVGTPQNGKVLHTIRLQQPVTGKLFVIGTGTLPLPDSGRISAAPPEFVAPEGSGITLAPQSHFWVIVNQSAGLLEPVDSSNDGDDVAPDEIQLPPGILQQSVAMRRLRSDRPDSPWQLTFPAQQQVSPAVVALADHTTIVAEDGTWRSRHNLQVLNESRQFLPVQLPEECRFMYCLVQGRPARVVTRVIDDVRMHLIPVPQSGELATPMDVEFALAGQLNLRRVDINGRDLTIPVPTFPEFRDDPEYGITVSRNKWSVLLPESWHASVLDDARQTNVIRADKSDLEDVDLLTVVDTTNSMINAYNSKKSRSSVTALYAELQRKESVLQVQRGNTTDAEQQRETVLRDLNDQLDVLKQQLSEPQNTISEARQSDINPFLESIDSDNNAFNFSNNNDLYLNNNAPAQVTDNTQSGLGFNFVVPAEPPTAKPQTRSEADNKAVDGKGKAGLKSEKKLAPEKQPQNRSKLLMNRGENLKQQSDRVQSKLGTVRGLTLQQNLNEEDVARNIPQFAPQTQNIDGAFLGRFSGQMDSAQTGMGSIAPPVALIPTGGDGMLSLEFDIPDAGVRHDFVRAGGNAMLTLTVRNRESIGTGLNLLWAVGCLFVATTLLKARSLPALLSRTCLVLAAVGLLGWLFLARDLSVVCLLLCILSTAVYCLILIVLSFRKSVQVAE